MYARNKCRFSPSLLVLLSILSVLSLQFLVPQSVVAQLTEPLKNIKFAGGIEYGKADGQKLLLDIYRPKAALPAGKLRPAVLLVHGGAWEEGNKEEFRDVAVYLANRGFVAVSINYRLMTETGNRWPAQIDDVQLAVRWLKQNAAEYGIDPERIGACGGSAGGHLVTLLATCDTLHPNGAALTNQSSRVTAVVNLAGPTDLTVNFARGVWLPMARDLQERLFSKKLDGPGPREASPLYHIDATTVPVLIMHGTDDQIVSIKQSENFVTAMTKAGRDARLIPFEGEGHGVSKPENLQKMMDEMVAFLSKHLNNGG